MIEFSINKTVLQIIMVQNCQRSMHRLIVIVVAIGMCWLYLFVCRFHILLDFLLWWEKLFGYRKGDG